MCQSVTWNGGGYAGDGTQELRYGSESFDNFQKNVAFQKSKNTMLLAIIKIF